MTVELGTSTESDRAASGLNVLCAIAISDPDAILNHAKVHPKGSKTPVLPGRFENFRW